MMFFVNLKLEKITNNKTNFTANNTIAAMKTGCRNAALLINLTRFKSFEKEKTNYVKQ
jgi:hypothetical protein